MSQAESAVSTDGACGNLTGLPRRATAGEVDLREIEPGVFVPGRQETAH